jgi:hypothetical protein
MRGNNYAPSVASLKFLFPLATAVAFCLAENVSQAGPTISTNFCLPSSRADASKPGFIWNFQQIRAWTPSGQSPRPATLQRADNQLAGLMGNNIADPNAVGVALGAATVSSSPAAPFTFEIATVINVDRVGGTSSGNFTPDEAMPGSPGLLQSIIKSSVNSDYQGAEALTWLDLPAGVITMGVNSDDGFRVTIGGANPSDLSAVNVGQFDAPRGAGNTFFQFTIQKAGLYAARMLWVNGISNSRVEWFTVRDLGGGVTNLVLINDTANGGIPAYRAVTGSAWASVRKAVPAQMVSMALPNTPVSIELQDGAIAIDAATVTLSLDGTAVATGHKAGSVTTASYTPPSPFASASTHTVTLTYTEGTKPVSMTWPFQVLAYPTLPASAKVAADTSKPGFVWNVFANSSDTATTIAKAESALAGTLTDGSGNLLPNLADPNAKGAAIATSSAPVPVNATIKFDIAGTINLGVSGGNNGDFPADGQMPGLPATDTTTTGVATEVLTYIALPAGLTVMGVTQDDGCRVTAGAQRDVFGALFLGGLDGAGLAEDGDHIFCVAAQEAGVYPFRVVYVQGTDAGSLEWFSVKADGTRVLVNDLANGGLSAYRATFDPIPPYVRSVSPDPVERQLNLTTSSLVIVLGDGTNPVNTNSIALKLDGQVLAPTIARTNTLVTITYTPTNLQVPNDGHTAELTFKDSTGAYTRNQAWRFYNLKNIVLGTPVLTENFDSYAEGSVPTDWVATNFTTPVTPGLDLNNLKSDSYLGWIVVSRDLITGLKASIAKCAPGQTVNGTPITFDDLCQGNLIYAESDTRGGNQVQFLVTKPYNLSSVNHPLVSFSSLYTQNQDNCDGMEYSVDGGVHWLPVFYYLDTKDGGGADIWVNLDGTVAAVKTFTDFNYDAATWVDNGVTKGFNYGDGLLAPITEALGTFIAPRWNDDQQIDKRWEIYRLPAAANKSDVRLRIFQLGTGSWYWGIDNLAFYDAPAAAAPKLTISASGKNVTISWTGSGTLLETTSLSGALWTVSPSQANPQTVSSGAAAKFYCIGAP